MKSSAGLVPNWKNSGITLATLMVISAPQALQNHCWLLDWNLWATHSIVSLPQVSIHIAAFRERDFVTTPLAHVNYDSTARHKVPCPLCSSYSLSPPRPHVRRLGFLRFQATLSHYLASNFLEFSGKVKLLFHTDVCGDAHTSSTSQVKKKKKKR